MFNYVCGVGIVEQDAWMRNVRKFPKGILPPPAVECDLPVERVRALPTAQDEVLSRFMSEAILAWARTQGFEKRLGPVRTACQEFTERVAGALSGRPQGEGHEIH